MPYTPICIAKAVKNSAESEGMRRAHVSKAACAEEGVCGGQKAQLPYLLCGFDLSSRDAGLLEPPERPQGSPAFSSVWKDPLATRMET